MYKLKDSAYHFREGLKSLQTKMYSGCLCGCVNLNAKNEYRGARPTPASFCRVWGIIIDGIVVGFEGKIDKVMR